MIAAQSIGPVRFMLLAILLVALLISRGVSSAESDVTETHVGDAAQKTVDADEGVAPTGDKEVTPAPGPETDRLRNRDLGKALEQFTPSEAISADNAVPFPIDI